MGEWVDENKEFKLLFVKMQKKSQDGRGVEGLVRGGGEVRGSGGCKPRIEGIVKWGCGFSQGDQSGCKPSIEVIVKFEEKIWTGGPVGGSGWGGSGRGGDGWM